ncbi:MAG: hypothetical protein GY696_38240, partial [Gammaproteobacteria bacterium]|nr:hypothetical protein [Gammaproteobacteria bacterium]
MPQQQNQQQQPHQFPQQNQQKTTGALLAAFSAPDQVGSYFQVPAETQATSMLLTAQVRIGNPDQPRKAAIVRAFLDSGSEKSFISHRVAQRLRLPVNFKQILSVLAFGAEKAQEMPSTNVSMTVTLRDGSKILLTNIHAVDRISGEIHRKALSSDDLSAISNIPPEDFADKIPVQSDNFKPDLLLGINLFLATVSMDQKKLLPSGLNLVNSKFGILVGGSNDDQVLENLNHRLAVSPISFSTQVKMSVAAMSLFSSPDPPLRVVPDLQDFWTLESIGITDDPNINDDDTALHRFYERIQFQDGRYHLAWPWIDDNPDLPDNRTLAWARFKSILRRYTADPALFKACNDVILDQVAKGVIEVVPDESEILGLCHYIPHHAVITPGKTTKTRIVYDASSKSRKGQKSLNECLLRGPVLVPDLVGLLLRFRLHRFGIISDIAKAFLQLALHHDQRDCTRFFWVKDINAHPPEAPSNIQVYRFTRVLFGS